MARSKEAMRRGQRKYAAKPETIAYQAEYRATHRERQRQLNREWRERPENQAKTREYRKSPEYQEWVKAYSRERYIAKKYGLTLEAFEALQIAHGHQCALCGIDEADAPGAGKRLHIDHDHRTGKVRGLLCLRCNLFLGYARDDESLLLKAVEYLRERA